MQSAPSPFTLSLSLSLIALPFFPSYFLRLNFPACCAALQYLLGNALRVPNFIPTRPHFFLSSHLPRDPRHPAERNPGNFRSKLFDKLKLPPKRKQIRSHQTNAVQE